MIAKSLKKEKNPRMTQKKAAENPLINLAFNVVIPVLILNKMSVSWGALQALAIALAFPVSYGIYDIIKNKKTNFIVVFGILNVLFTGGLALMKLEGIWFAVKEAAFPILVGLFVFASAFTRKPFIQTFFMNDQILNIELIQARVQELKKEFELEKLIKQSTIFLSLSFVLSAVLNFALAKYIFTPLDQSLASEARDIALNEQISAMTKYSFIVIMIPCMICLIAILFHFLSRLSSMTHVSRDELLNQHKK